MLGPVTCRMGIIPILTAPSPIQFQPSHDTSCAICVPSCITTIMPLFRQSAIRPSVANNCPVRRTLYERPLSWCRCDSHAAPPSGHFPPFMMTATVRWASLKPLKCSSAECPANGDLSIATKRGWRKFCVHLRLNPSLIPVRHPCARYEPLCAQAGDGTGGWTMRKPRRRQRS